jgi:hypothetical protein
MKSTITRLLLAVAATALVTVARPTSARAQARHERVAVSPMIRGGKTIGARIKLTLRPGGQHTSGRVVLGKYVPWGWKSPGYREAASEPSHGYVQHELYRFTDQAAASEHTFELEYGEGNTFAGGEKLDLASVWTGGAAIHVWGMNRFNSSADPITLPK